MHKFTRRSMLAFPAVQALAAAVKPVKITGIDLYDINLPATETERNAGFYTRFNVVQIDTDAGVRGYSFAGPGRNALPAVQAALIGADLFATEKHLASGIAKWGGVEHAIWDAIGKIAGQPVYKFLGGSADRVKAYITCVWPGPADQQQVPYKSQVDMAVKLQKAGFKGMKIRAWRPNPMDDVEVCRQIKAAVGRNFEIMFDRTAHAPVDAAGQKIWDFETGLRVGRGLQEAGALWLEEPFAREDYQSPARLAAELDMAVTGGEGYNGLEPYRQCLLHRTYDILQPDGRGAGGILICRKVATLAENYSVPVILHGTMSLLLAGWLQATLAIGAPWQEVALVTPPLLPQEQWSPALHILKSKELFTFEDGYLMAPKAPGIGIDIDEEKLKRFRA